MAAIGEWAAFFGGSYCGWMRPPGGEWEDVIGSVKLECVAGENATLDVTIRMLEFGIWTGCLRPDEGVLEGTTGQGDTRFKCVFRERHQADGIQGCFDGTIFNPPAEMLFEFRLVSDWRKRRPGQE